MSRKTMLLIGVGAIVVIGIGIGVAAALGVFGSRNAKVNTVDGTVDTRFGSQGEFAVSEVGQTLKADDAVRTGNDGRALLILDDGTGLRLSEDSLLEMTRIEGSSDNPIIRLTLNAGKLFNILPSEHTEQSQFEIETPTGVVSVRGSMMSVAYSSGAGTEATCLSGHCAVSAGGQTADLTTGTAATVDPQQQISAVQDMNSAQKFAWVPVIAEARQAGVAVDQAIQTGCTCTGTDLVCQDGTTVPFYPTCTNQKEPTDLLVVSLPPNTLAVTNFDGSNPRTVAQIDLAGEGTWSPDGKQIAFAASTGTTSDIFVVNADGTGLTQLTTGEGVNISPTWTPDGSKITFSSDRIQPDIVSEIYTIDPDGSNLTQVTSMGVYAISPTWSPEGSTIAFSAFRNNISNIAVVNVDGTGFAWLTDVIGQALEPDWSPDGSKIVFTSTREAVQPGDCADCKFIWVMNTDGSNLVQLTSGSNFDNQPKWSPDGSKILFHSDREGRGTFTMNADGTEITRVGDAGILDWWSPPAP